jgi:hypothetical protein
MEFEWVPGRGMLVQTPMGIGVIVGRANKLRWDSDPRYLTPQESEEQFRQFPWEVLVDSRKINFNQIELERV